MKYLVCLLFAITGLTAFGNMASPYQEGTSASTAISSRDIDILRETIDITLQYSKAYYKVKYTIHCDTTAKQVPLLFVAKDYSGEFTILVDGHAVKLKPLNHYSGTLQDKFPFTAANPDEAVIHWNNKTTGAYALSDLIYFEAKLTKGTHEIQVEYEANAFMNRSDWVTEYTYLYSLAPAKYWRSFGTLEVNLHCKAEPDTLFTNLGTPANTSPLKTTWKFPKLPADFIEVNYKPAIGKPAKFFLAITPEGIGFTALLLMFIWHLRLLHLAKQDALQFSYRGVFITGVFLIPFAWYLLYLFSFNLIDGLIGPAASGRHGYVGLAIVFYQVMVPVYALLVWLCSLVLYKILWRSAR